MDVAGSPCQVHAVDYVSPTLRNTASRSRSCRVDLLQHSAVAVSYTHLTLPTILRV